jgi:hypothetical protein
MRSLVGRVVRLERERPEPPSAEPVSPHELARRVVFVLERRRRAAPGSPERTLAENVAAVLRRVRP